MPTPILMPQLSPTMEEGTLAKWHVKEGDEVRSGDMVAEIETDKATMEFEAAEDGVIEKLLLAEGTDARARQPSHRSAHDRGRSAPRRGSASPLEGEIVRRSPERETIAGEGDQAAEQVLSKIAEQIRRNDRNGQDAKRIFASPLARRLARELGLELAALNGSGPHGRIVKSDVERAVRETMPPAERVAAPKAEPEALEQVPEPRTQELVARREAPEPHRLSDSQVLALYEPGSYEIVPHDTMRRVIAERLTLSKQTIPHFYLAIDCTLDALLAARARLNALAPQEGPRAFKLSVNDFIIKALAMALQTVPAANASWTEQGLLRHRASDIAVAVALEGGGLAYAGDPRRRDQEPVGDLERDAGSWPPARAPSAWRRTNIRGARPPSPISACTASTASMPSSTRRKPRSSRSAAPRSAQSSRTMRSRSRP